MRELNIKPNPSSLEIEKYIEKYFLDNILFSKLSIGIPKQTIETIFKAGSQDIEIISTVSLHNYYDYNKSTTFTELKKSINNDWIEASETLFFFNKFLTEEKDYKTNINNNNDKVNQNLTLNVQKNDDGKECYKDFEDVFVHGTLNIGLKIISQVKGKIPSFLEQLKFSGKISQYIWSIYFFNKDKNINNNNYNTNDDIYEGVYVFGENPHKYNKNKYKINNYIKKSAYIDQGISTWAINFDNVYYVTLDNRKIEINIDYSENKDGENKNNEYYKVLGIFNIEKNYNIGSDEYYFAINNDYFHELFQKNICQQFKNDIYIIYYCKGEDFEKNYLKKFPSLKFFSRDFSYEFIFDYKDLFISLDNNNINNKIYVFNIFFKIYHYYDSDTDWSFGRTFFEKYQLTFDSDRKTIGFYNPDIYDENVEEEEIINIENNKGNQNKNNGNNNDEKENIFNVRNIIGIIIIVLLLLIFCYLIILGRKIFIKNGFVLTRAKKYANELDDDFAYSSYKDSESNSNSNSNNKPIYGQNIEMSSK